MLRAIHESKRTDIQVVAINDLAPVETNAHLLRYDSVHGRFPGEVKVDGEVLSFKQHLDSDQFKIDLTYTLTVSGNTLTGEANSDFGPTPITGTRAQ